MAHHESLPLGVYYGVFTRSVTNIVIRGNQFLNFKRHAVVVNGRGFLIESNYFTAPYGYDAIMPNTSDTIIRRNIFYDVSNYGYLTNGLHCDLIQTFSLGDSGWATNVVVEENLPELLCDANPHGGSLRRLSRPVGLDHSQQHLG